MRGAKACPAWISEQAGFMETNISTGEERFIVGCFFQVIPKLMVEVIKASNRPAAAVESMRNETTLGLARIAGVMGDAIKQARIGGKNGQRTSRRVAGPARGSNKP